METKTERNCQLSSNNFCRHESPLIPLSKNSTAKKTNPLIP